MNKHEGHHIQLHEVVEVSYPVNLFDGEVTIDWLLAENHELPEVDPPCYWCVECERQIEPQEIGMETVSFG